MTYFDHLPILLVVVPLLAAPLCLVITHNLTGRVLSVLVPWVTLFHAVQLLQRVLEHGSISYTLGGWAAPYGIEYRIDAANAYVLLVVAGIASVVLPFFPGRVGAAISDRRERLFYATFLLCFAGLLGIAATGDAFNVFVFLEISSLASYGLVALGRDRGALMAAYTYLIIGTLGGTFILLGTGLMYQMTGTLNMADLASRLPDVLDTRTVLVAFVFLFVGVSIKLALFPLHQWLPNAYTQAPAAVSAFLAATATKVQYYLLVRIVFTIFGTGFVFGVLKLDKILLPLSILAMFSGSIAAVFQTDVKRVLAYSSVAQIGYMTLGLSFASETGLVGGLVHLFNHALMKGGLFLAVACLAMAVDSPKLEDLRGLGRAMPWSMGAFVVGGLAMIGVPGTVGFVSKWYLVKAALEQGRFAVAALIVLSSLLAIIYVWRIVEVGFFTERPEKARIVREAPIGMLVPTWVLIGATVYFGLHTSLTVGVAETAVAALFGATP